MKIIIIYCSLMKCMKGILAVMSTTYVAVEISLEKWPPTVVLLVELLEHSTDIAEVMVSNPVRVWIFFFWPYFLYYISSIHYCENRFHTVAIEVWIEYLCVPLHSVSAYSSSRQFPWKQIIFRSCMEIVLIACRLIFMWAKYLPVPLIAKT